MDYSIPEVGQGRSPLGHHHHYSWELTRWSEATMAFYRGCTLPRRIQQDHLKSATPLHHHHLPAASHKIDEMPDSREQQPNPATRLPTEASQCDSGHAHQMAPLLAQHRRAVREGWQRPEALVHDHVCPLGNVFGVCLWQKVESSWGTLCRFSSARVNP